MERLEPFILLENDRGQFSNTTFAAGLPFAGKSHGTNCADLFGDGRMSIIIASGGGYPGDLLMTAVHCPKELPGAYLNVRLVGVRSNRDGNGARITLRCGESRQMREVTNGASLAVCRWSSISDWGRPGAWTRWKFAGPAVWSRMLRTRR